MKYEKNPDMKNISSIKEAHLVKMKVSSTNDLNAWFLKKKNNAYRIDGIDRIVSLLIMLEKETMIYIIGDYDCDGIMATSILMRALQRYGFSNVRFRLPKKFSEGFGMNMKIVDEIPDGAVIITCDNGVAAVNEVAYAKKKGHTVIVTDHHQASVDEHGDPVYPPADIVVDPAAIPGSADFDGYCGAGIAYRIAEALLPGDNILPYLMGLAAIATICDSVPLREENYVLTRNGIAYMNKGATLPGISGLCSVLGISRITETAIGFQIGPCINAPERMRDGDAYKSVLTMLEDEQALASEMALHLKDINEARKAARKDACEDAYAILRGKQLPYPLLMHMPNVSEGIIGIVAGELCEKLKIPVGIFTNGEKGYMKGSFRSPEDYNMKQHMDMVKDIFYKYGGHAQAAGATIESRMFTRLQEELERVSERPAQIQDNDILYYDAEITDHDIAAAIEENLKYAPFGQDNPDLIYKIKDFGVISYYGECVKKINGGFRLRSQNCSAIAFDIDPPEITGPCNMTLYGKIGYNYYKGKTYPQVELIGYEM